MAVPASAKVFQESMDPYDVLDFEVNIEPLLETSEGVNSYTVAAPTESTLFGLEIKEGGGYSITLVDNKLTFYVGIDPLEQANPAFDLGVTLPIEIGITTNSTPPRKKQRTVAVKVVQR